MKPNLQANAKAAGNSLGNKILIMEDSGVSNDPSSMSISPDAPQAGFARPLAQVGGVHSPSMNMNQVLQNNQMGAMGAQVRKLKFDERQASYVLPKRSSSKKLVTATGELSGASRATNQGTRDGNEGGEARLSDRRGMQDESVDKYTPLSSRHSRSSRNSDNRKNMNVLNAIMTLNKNKESLEKPDKFKMILNSRIKQKSKVESTSKVFRNYEEIKQNSNSNTQSASNLPPPQGSKSPPGNDKGADLATLKPPERKPSKLGKSKEAKAKPEGKGNFKLTNQYNETTLIERFKIGMNLKVTSLMKEKLEAGISKKRNTLIRKNLSPTLFDRQVLSRTAGSGDAGSALNSSIESKASLNIDFFQHYEIQQMLTLKCVVASCHKLRDRKFMLKQIMSSTLELQDFINVHKKGQKKNSGEQPLNEDMLINYIDLVKDWMDLPPQVPKQNLLNCYGVIMIKENVYLVCDLIQDNVKLPFQLAYDRCSGKDFEIDSEDKPEPNISSNMYDFIRQMQLGNLSSLKQIPEYYVNCLLRFIIHVTRAFAHAHENNIVHGNFNLSRVIAQKLEQRDLRQTYSSRSFIGASAKGKAGQASRETVSPDPAKESTVASVHSQNLINYIVVNFEAWRVDQLIKKYAHDEDSIFKEAIKNEKLSIDRDAYIKVLKITDLQAFGSAILEMLVGKCQETANLNDETASQAKKENRGPNKSSKQNSVDNTNTPASLTAMEVRSSSQMSNQARATKQANGGELLIGSTSPVSSQSKRGVDAASFGSAAPMPGTAPVSGRRAETRQNSTLETNPDDDRPPSQGKTRESSKMGVQPPQSKLMKGSVSMDSIPLNWGKHPIIGSILKILQMCIGPYGVNNNFSQMDTAQVFREIHLIACEKYHQQFGEVDRTLESQEHYNPATNRLVRQPDWSKTFRDRLQSSVLNNQGIMMFLTITEDTFHQLRCRTLQFIHRCFKEAIALSGDNVAAKLNKALLEWYTGELRDEDFQCFLKEHIQQQEPEAASLMHLLFKEKLQGFAVPAADREAAVKLADANFKRTSNLTRYLLQHQDFAEHRVARGNQRAGRREAANYGMNSSLDQHQHNAIIDLHNPTLGPQKIFVSNNDNFIGVIGTKKIIVIDVRTEKQIYNAALPLPEAPGPLESFQKATDSDEATNTHNNTRSQIQMSPQPGPVKVQEAQQPSQTSRSYAGGAAQSNEFNVMQEESVDKSAGGNVGPAPDLLNEGGAPEVQDRGAQKKSQEYARSQPMRISHQTTQGQSNQVGQSLQRSRVDPRTGKQDHVAGNLDPLHSLNSEATNVIRANFTVITAQSGEMLVKDPNSHSVGSVSPLPHSQRSFDGAKVPTNLIRENVTRIAVQERDFHDSSRHNELLNQKSSPRSALYRQHKERTPEHQVHAAVLHGSSIDSPEARGPPRVEITEEMRNQGREEAAKLMQAYPPVWLADIRNNGKMLALFDRNQQERNNACKHRFMRQETMFIQNVVISSASLQQVYALDMRKLLREEEVLSFGFEDFNDSFSTIYVQSKELYLYQIDFMNHQVLRRVDDSRHSLEMKSVFYNTYLRDRGSLEEFQPIKELIEHQEGIGNKVLMPKVNNQILAVKLKDSNVIRIYNIKLRRYTREFTLCKEEASFEDIPQVPGSSALGARSPGGGAALKSKKTYIEKKLNKFEQESKNNKRVPSNFMLAYQQNREKTLQEYKNEFKMKQLEKNYEMDGDGAGTPVSSCCHHDQESEKNMNLLEISPSGRVLVSTFGDQADIFVKVINEQTVDDQYNISTAHVESSRAPFMPIYFDYDYVKACQYKDGGPGDSHSTETLGFQKEDTGGSTATLGLKNVTFMMDMDKDRKKQYMRSQALLTHAVPYKLDPIEKLLPGTIDRACYSFSQLGRIQGNQYQRNERLLELVQFVNVVLQNPRLLMDCPLRKKNRFDKIAVCMNMIRYIQSMDFANITVKGLLGLQPLFHFENLNFLRSYQYIKSFSSATVSKSNICAVMADRKLQVYDYVSSKLLFEINAPNSGAFCLKQGMKCNMEYQQIFFLDNDNIIAFQDAERRIQFIGIQSQIESFSNQNNKQQSKDITIKIDKPIGEDIDIKNEFGPLDENANDENGSDASGDPLSSGLVASKFLHFDEPIHSVFTNSNQSDLSYMALIGKLRFSLYYVQDDSMGSCDINLIWNKDYRFDKYLKSMGQIISMAFEKTCMTFITGSEFGYICIWDFQQKKLLRRIKPKSRQSCNILRTQVFDKKIMSYSIETQILTLINVKNQFHEQTNNTQANITEHEKDGNTARFNKSQDQSNVSMTSLKKSKTKLKADDSMSSMGLNPKSSSKDLNGPKGRMSLKGNMKDQEKPPKKSEIDSIEVEKFELFANWSAAEKKQKGLIIQIEIDRQQNICVIVFKNKYVQVYDIQDFSKVKLMQQFGPFKTNQIFVDEFCTYMAVLDENQKRIQYYAFHWDYFKQTIMKPSEMNMIIGNELTQTFTKKLVNGKLQIQFGQLDAQSGQSSPERDGNQEDEGENGDSNIKKVVDKDAENSKVCNIF